MHRRFKDFIGITNSTAFKTPLAMVWPKQKLETNLFRTGIPALQLLLDNHYYADSRSLQQEIDREK